MHASTWCLNAALMMDAGPTATAVPGRLRCRGWHPPVALAWLGLGLVWRRRCGGRRGAAASAAGGLWRRCRSMRWASRLRARSRRPVPGRPGCARRPGSRSSLTTSRSRCATRPRAVRSVASSRWRSAVARARSAPRAARRKPRRAPRMPRLAAMAHHGPPQAVGAPVVWLGLRGVRPRPRRDPGLDRNGMTLPSPIARNPGDRDPPTARPASGAQPPDAVSAPASGHPAQRRLAGAVLGIVQDLHRLRSSRAPRDVGGRAELTAADAPAVSNSASNAPRAPPTDRPPTPRSAAAPAWRASQRPCHRRP